MNKIGSKYQNVLAVFSHKCNKASQIFLDYSNLSGRRVSICFYFFFFSFFFCFTKNGVVFKQFTQHKHKKSKEQCFSLSFLRKKRDRERTHHLSSSYFLPFEAFCSVRSFQTYLTIYPLPQIKPSLFGKQEIQTHHYHE